MDWVYDIFGPILLLLLVLGPFLLFRYFMKVGGGPQAGGSLPPLNLPVVSEWATEQGLAYRSMVSGNDRRFARLLQGANGLKWNWVCGLYHGRWMQAFCCRSASPVPKSVGVVILRCKYRLNRLLIRPQKSLDVFGKAAKLMDIDFESWEFNQQFVVKAGGRKWAYYVLHQEAMEVLLKYGRDFGIEFNGHWAMIWQESPMTPDDIYRAFAVLANVLDMIPAYRMKKRSR